MSISYSKSFTDMAGTKSLRMGRKRPGTRPPSTFDDLTDPNLRHRYVSGEIDDGDAGTYCLSVRNSAPQTANALVVVGMSKNPVAPDSVEVHSVTQRLHTFGQPVWKDTTWVGLMDRTYADVNEFYWCFPLAVGEEISCRFLGFCEMARIPRDPNSVKTEHLRLGLRSEFPGQQFHQEGLGTYRRITLNWERLGADDLAVLDEAYHTNPTLEAPVVLYDDTDPQGAAYGRFIGFDWQSGAFELTFDAQMVFEEIVSPR